MSKFKKYLNEFKVNGKTVPSGFTSVDCCFLCEYYESLDRYDGKCELFNYNPVHIYDLCDKFKK